MELSEKYPALANLVGGYFHQDWKECYLWDSNPDYPPIVRFYKTNNGIDWVNQTIAELKEILSKDYDESTLKTIIYRKLHMNLHLPHWNLTYKEWLEDVLRILEEPMEKTKKQYIPYKA
jgi:CdiI immunity protein